MGDPTRPGPDDALAPPDWPVPDLARPWFERLCPLELAERAHELDAEGQLLLRWLRPWADEVQATLDAYEAAVGPHHLSDDHHRLVGTVSGVLALHRLLEQVGLAAMATH